MTNQEVSQKPKCRNRSVCGHEVPTNGDQCISCEAKEKGVSFAHVAREREETARGNGTAIQHVRFGW